MKFSEWSDRARVERVAQEARLKLDPTEADRLTQEMKELLSMLDEMPLTEGEAPMSNEGVVTDLDLRADVAIEGLPREALLHGAPRTNGGYFAVGRTLGDEHEN